MKTIHLKCGHTIKVKEWPSQAGLAKVRAHYKKYHPEIMKEITAKSLKTKLSEGIIKHINPELPNNLGDYTHILSKTPSGWNYQVFKGNKKIGTGSAASKPEASKKIAGIIMKRNPVKQKNSELHSHKLSPTWVSTDTRYNKDIKEAVLFLAPDAIDIHMQDTFKHKDKYYTQVWFYEKKENPKPLKKKKSSSSSLSVPHRHQLKIARSTLKMSDAGALIMGGMTKQEAREVIKKLTGKTPKENPKKKTFVKYTHNSIVLYKFPLPLKDILFGIIKLPSKDHTKYVVQWYSPTEKIESITERKIDLDKLPVLYIPEKQDIVVRFMPQIIKTFSSKGMNKAKFITKLQDIVGLNKVESTKIWLKLKKL